MIRVKLWESKEVSLRSTSLGFYLQFMVGKLLDKRIRMFNEGGNK